MIETMGYFPRVAGSNLQGRHFELPLDFGGAINIVVIAFSREQQSDVDTWMPWLKALARDRDGVRVYELPTISRGFGMMRGFIDSGMRRGIPDAAVRASTITLYVDKEAFRHALALPDEHCVYVLLVDRHGRIHGRAEGTFTPEAGEALASALASADRRDPAAAAR